MPQRTPPLRTAFYAAAPVPMGRRAWRTALCLCAVLGVVALLAGCSAPAKVYSPQENFGSVATYSRLFDAAPAQTCEAARRALLSQGYIINTHVPEMVEGRKNFQPEADAHLQMMIRVVCVPESASGKISLGFVTALQDRYTLKKTNNSASLGVGGVGSVSLPLLSTDEALIKVGSETIASDGFYDSFFELVNRYLAMGEGAVE